MVGNDRVGPMLYWVGILHIAIVARQVGEDADVLLRGMGMMFDYCPCEKHLRDNNLRFLGGGPITLKSISWGAK